MSTISATSTMPASMLRSVSSDSTVVSVAINPTTARLQRLPTPPRSPGLIPLGKQLTLIEPPMTKNIRFLILDCPTDSTLPFYMTELKRYGVTDVVRCCEPTYSAETLQNQNIAVHDWPFRDGAVVSNFVRLLLVVGLCSLLFLTAWKQEAGKGSRKRKREKRCGRLFPKEQTPKAQWQKDHFYQIDNPKQPLKKRISNWMTMCIQELEDNNENIRKRA